MDAADAEGDDATVAGGDPVGPIDGEVPEVKKKERNRMCKLSVAEWTKRAGKIGSTVQGIVDELNLRSPEGRAMSVSYSLTIALDVMERSKAQNNAMVLRPGQLRHYASAHVLIKQQNATDALSERMKNLVQQAHLERPYKQHEEEEEEEEHVEPQQNQQHVSREPIDKLSSVRSLLNKYLHDEWGLERGVVECHVLYAVAPCKNEMPCAMRCQSSHPMCQYFHCLMSFCPCSRL